MSEMTKEVVDAARRIVRAPLADDEGNSLAYFAGSYAEKAVRVVAYALLTERDRLEAVREELRVLMLKQPTTDNRDTYSDGFQQGLVAAMYKLDAALTTPGDPERALAEMAEEARRLGLD